MHVQMRNFEKLGMTREQSERLTRDLTEILCINKDKIAAQFVSKSTLEKVSTSHPGVQQHIYAGRMDKLYTCCVIRAGFLLMCQMVVKSSKLVLQMQL